MRYYEFFIYHRVILDSLVCDGLNETLMSFGLIHFTEPQNHPEQVHHYISFFVG